MMNKTFKSFVHKHFWFFSVLMLVLIALAFFVQSALAASCYTYTDSFISINGCTNLYFTGVAPNEKYAHRGTSNGTVNANPNTMFLAAYVTSWDEGYGGTCYLRHAYNSKTGTTLQVWTTYKSINTCGCQCSINHIYYGTTDHTWGGFQYTTERH